MVWKKNVDLIGYHDLGGRPGFKLAMQEVGGAYFLYVASMWDSGWTILDVTDPAAPASVRWVDGPTNTWTIQVQIADGLMITGQQMVPPSWPTDPRPGKPDEGLMIFDVAQPDEPKLLGRWATGAQGTHRNFYNGGRYVHATATLPGFEGFVYGIVDIDDPSAPRLAGKWWYPGQRTEAGESYAELDRRRITGARPYPNEQRPNHALSLHGGAYIDGGRAYCPWMRAGLVTLDVSVPTEPTLLSILPFHPPLGSTIAVHSAVPLPGTDLVVVNSEALRERCEEPVNIVGIVDVTDPAEPVLISLFPQPRPPAGYGPGGFVAKGGRFGPHNQHQYQNMDCLLRTDRYVYMTFFNAGLQVFDVSDPRDPYVAGYYVPDDPPRRFGPLPTDLVVQAEDVLVDRRGVIYMTEKNSGLYILDFAPGNE